MESALMPRFLQMTAQSRMEDEDDINFTMQLLFLPRAPEGQENICAITQDEIGSVAYTTPYFCGSASCGKRKAPCSDGPCPPVLSKHPHLHCIQLPECQHYFDARALVIHFMRNSMTCPLCRGGHPSAVLSAAHTFPNEEWILSVEREIKREAQPADITRVVIQDTALRSPSVMVSLFLYDSHEENGHPVHGMQFPMFLEPVLQRRNALHNTQEQVLLALNQLEMLPLSEVLIEYQLDQESLRYSLLQ